MIERSPKERLFWLLELFRNKEIDFDTFCNEFHITYDHHVDYDELTEEENSLFEKLARSASRFSGSSEDHKMYPNVYSDSDEITAITDEIFTLLKL